MSRSLLFSLLAAASLLRAAEQPVTFQNAAGVPVFGEFYSADAPSRPTILLFHMAGSNHAEYNPIAPKLMQLGFNCLAIDQSSGGTMWGTRNRTAAAFRAKFHRAATYMEAKKDLEAALNWATREKHSGPVILWGSSYSAAMVFLLAAEHPDQVKAVLAFSPSEYLEPQDAVATAAPHVKCPVFIDSAKNPEEIASANAILERLGSTNKTQFQPGVDGVHGSSTLRADRNPKGADENWKAVAQFLAQLH